MPFTTLHPPLTDRRGTPFDGFSIIIKLEILLGSKADSRKLKIGEIFLIVWLTFLPLESDTHHLPPWTRLRGGMGGGLTAFRAVPSSSSIYVFSSPWVPPCDRCPLPSPSPPWGPFAWRLCFCGTLNVKKSRWSDLVPKIKRTNTAVE